MAVHVVKPGDTLWSISRTYRVGIPEINEVNGLTSDFLMPGLALYLPTQTLPERYYRVENGDTLWSIAQQFESSIELILQANPVIAANNLSIGQVINIPSSRRYSMQTLAFVDAFIPSPLTEKLTRLSPILTYIAIFTYAVLEDGSLTDVDDESLLEASNRLNIAPLMVVSNYAEGTFSPELAGKTLQPEIRPLLISNIVRILNEKGYAGVSLDFEFIPPESRVAFTRFLIELKEAIGDLILQVNVFSKSADMPNNPFAGAFDYAAIGQIADIVTVLTYDYGYTTGPPDPVAPIWWVEQVLEYAANLIPNNKLMIAIPLYGYNWNTSAEADSTTPARAIPVLQAQQLAQHNRSVIYYDQQAQSPYYTYTINGQNHTVWFEDIRSITAKYRLLETHNLLGAAYWRLRYDFPQNWAYVERNVNVLS
ncbi:glycosyl hydrolase family 18 protein [Sediminibacillus albus]|uniref:Spore germination protein n=1 Tax=Sediminibacillus albus TaxID=407036 RepID=A0A1G8X0X7_9BACI|nr:LysM peptidoglycan-binding domain-containing protein [Sediminibacillus albus]SDJ84121.1 spore germination protein [Sediminibacillus albus]